MATISKVQSMLNLATIINKTNRVPSISTRGSSWEEARKLDMALASVNYKLSTELYNHLGSSETAEVVSVSKKVIQAVNDKLGNSVKHNTFFAGFPNKIDGSELAYLKYFESWWNKYNTWAKYGAYSHSYEEMVSHQEEFMGTLKGKVTVLHLGKTLVEELFDLYLNLAQSQIPLSDEDKTLLGQLAERFVTRQVQPSEIPIRENLALINKARIQVDQPLLGNTVTDALRLMAALSDGDVSLETKTKFKSPRRAHRRAIMNMLDLVVEENNNKLGDVIKHREQWKRVGERVHPHEFSGMKYAKDVFAVARGDKECRSIVGSFEVALASKDYDKAFKVIAGAPGYLFRNLDRLLRLDGFNKQLLVSAATNCIDKVSGRVLLSVRQHLMNREETNKQLKRMFVNKAGKAWVAEDEREAINKIALTNITNVIDSELNRRFNFSSLEVEPELLGAALPLSEKTAPSGFGVFPRGSTTTVGQCDSVRFFIYWKEKQNMTDYDLSCLLLDENFNMSGSCSFRSLFGRGIIHSGDITSAPNGASEFIDVKLNSLDKNIKYIVPQVNLYSGEKFVEAEECFFGFMERTKKEAGLPFEPKTVRCKSEMRGEGNVSLPLVICRKDDGTWSVKWLHLYLNGTSYTNMVEKNKASTSLIVRSIVERKYLDFNWLKGLVVSKENGETVKVCMSDSRKDDAEQKNMKVVTLTTLRDVLPS